MRNILKLSLPAIAASLLIAACGSSSPSSTSSASRSQPAAQTSSGSSSTVLVKSASSSLGKILIDSQGKTLYHLSGEKNGKFICISSTCVGVWHPLIVPSSGTPSGAVGSLGTVKRPDGTVQVTYKGTPLYTFTGDQQAGETKGQGIKDIGTWTAVTTSSTPTTSTSSTPAAPATNTGSEESSSGGGYGY
jgi:predicted lipoprotein with Yx(FWY)xxD motif